MPSALDAPYLGPEHEGGAGGTVSGEKEQGEGTRWLGLAL